MGHLSRIEDRERAINGLTSTGADKTYPSPDSPTNQNCSPLTCEPTSFRSVAKEHIWRLRNEAERLEALLNALPIELPFQADRALIELLGG